MADPRRWRARHDPDSHPRYTIELDPKARALVQIRGFANRLPGPRPMRVIQAWASQHGLRIARHAAG